MYELKKNLRFKLLISTFLLSLLLAILMYIFIDSHNVYITRLQQAYGYLALLYWYFALIVSPIKAISPENNKYVKRLLFARRAIGVSAFYFAVLHATIAFFGQLEGFSGISYYPRYFSVSLLFGLIGLSFLLVMTVTSFDKIVDFLTFKKWKLLHRLGYFAAILVYLHVWMVGTYLGRTWLQIIILALLLMLFVLESWRLSNYFENRYKKTRVFTFLIFILTLALLCGLTLAIPSIVERYHGDHENLEVH